MKLLGSVPSPYTRKVRIVLAEKKIDCEFEVADVLPHPSWRNRAWILRNPWFTRNVIPELRKRVKAAI